MGARARQGVRPRRPPDLRRDRPRRRGGGRPAASGVRRGSDRRVPQPRPAPAPPLPRVLPVAGCGVGSRRRRAPRQARHARVAARKGCRPVGGVRPRRRHRRPAPAVPVRGQRPRGGHPGQAQGACAGRRSPAAADDPRRDVRRARPGRTASRRVRQDRGARPRQAARHPRPAVGPARHVRAGPRPRGRDDAGPGRLRRHGRPHRRLPVRVEGRPDPGRPPRPRAGAHRPGPRRHRPRHLPPAPGHRALPAGHGRR